MFLWNTKSHNWAESALVILSNFFENRLVPKNKESIKKKNELDKQAYLIGKVLVYFACVL